MLSQVALVLVCLVGVQEGADIRDLAAKAATDLSARLGIAEDSIELDDAWPVDWPDTSIGVPEPGMMYAQVITPGHAMVLLAGGAPYEYHAGGGRVVYKGPYEEPEVVQLADLHAMVELHDRPRVAVEGTLVYLDGRTLIYEGAAEPDRLPRDEIPVAVEGPAQRPFVAKHWGDSRTGAALVRVVGRAERVTPGRAVAEPVPTLRINADRIVALPARARHSGVLSYEELARDPDRYHEAVVTVQGRLQTAFETVCLEPLDPQAPKVASAWVAGDLSGLRKPPAGSATERARVEITGLFERRAQFSGGNGYGPGGRYPFRITAQSVHAIGSVIAYDDMVSNSAALDGTVVAVQGLLHLGGGMSDLSSLRATGSVTDPGCLVSGDLSAVAPEASYVSGAGTAVLVVGRLLVAKTEGFGRGGTRRLKLDSAVVRPLTLAELPTPEQVWPALAFVRKTSDASGTLVVEGPGTTPKTLESMITDFALAPRSGDRRRLVVVPVAGGSSLQIVRTDDLREEVASATWISAPAWAPDGSRFAALVDGQVVVYEAATGSVVTVGLPPSRSGAAISDFAWSPAGDALLYNVRGPNTAQAVVLDLATATCVLLDPSRNALGWIGPDRGTIVEASAAPGPAADGQARRLLVRPWPGRAAEDRTLLAYPEGETVSAFAKSPVAEMAAVASGPPDGSGPVHLYLVALNGTGARRMLYAGASEIRSLCWAGDGSALAFLVRRGESWSVAMVTAGGRRLLDIPNVLPCAPQMLAGN